MTDAIEVQGLAKTYRRPFGAPQPALRGVDLKVAVGSAFGLIGPNGAGKTTFIKLALGIAFPTAGTVQLLGGSPSDPRVRARVGYLPERLDLPAVWTPRQLLRSVSRMKGLSLATARIDGWLERVGIASDANRSIGGFSKGMRQRVGLAAALIGDPELLILDEPTDGLDPLARVEVRTLLTEAKDRGATVFLNSHLLAETEKICDHVAILAKGQVLRTGAVADLRAARGGFRARFQGADAGRLEPLGFTRSNGDGAFSFLGDAAAINQALEAARLQGALLIELAPNAPDLEAVFAEVVGA
jgi:ABC-2 type transport system ATP-binding protein